MASKPEQLTFTAVPRDGDEPSARAERLVSMLVTLLRDRSISYAWFYERFERSERQFVRDLKHLRAIGEGLGIEISSQRRGRARLLAIAGRNRLADAAPDGLPLLRAIARALGPVVQHELGLTAGGDDAQSFLSFAWPRLVAGSDVAETFVALRDAFEARARIRFVYRGGNVSSDRTVEPYRVLVRSGRYYLIAFDVARGKGWRYFALDRIAAPIVRAGTFAPRPIPKTYLDGESIGMLQGGTVTAVTVRLSPVVAPSATSRLWQKTQVVRTFADGSAEMTFHATDPQEVVRWALGFGAEARVVAPPSAVAAAERTLAALQSLYRPKRALAG